MSRTTSEVWTTPAGYADAKGHTWAVCLTWANIAGRLECTGLRIEPASTRDRDTQKLTAALVRELPIGALIDQLRRDAFEKAHLRAEAGMLHAAHRNILAAREFPSEAEYRALRTAVTYSRAWHEDPAPVKAVMREWGVKRSTAGRYVERARNEYGFLQPTVQRQQNGNLTTKAERLLGRFGDNWAEWEQAIQTRKAKGHR